MFGYVPFIQFFKFSCMMLFCWMLLPGVHLDEPEANPEPEILDLIDG